ncbi:MAG: hypothetical protein N3D11_03590, partial [Candidatus Sumerlaeia bacterium]|nr:hypothetical protein [Candidatus Sumerlaeia bacterium]
MFFRLFKLYRHYRFLLRTQWATEKTLRQLQLRGLKQIVRHAYQQVPYYRRLFDKAGFHPDQLQSLDDLRRIPISDKAAMAPYSRKDLVAANIPARELLPLSTAGSTGHPLNFCISRDAKFLRVVTEWRALSAHGVRWTD